MQYNMFQIGRMAGTATIAGVAMQHPNVYNSRLPHTETMKEDSAAYLQEIRVNLAKAVLDNDMGQCIVWVINLQKYTLSMVSLGPAAWGPASCLVLK